MKNSLRLNGSSCKKFPEMENYRTILFSVISDVNSMVLLCYDSVQQKPKIKWNTGNVEMSTIDFHLDINCFTSPEMVNGRAPKKPKLNEKIVCELLCAAHTIWSIRLECL